MADEAAQAPGPMDPSGACGWQHYALTLQGANRGPFEEWTERQREALRLLGNAGWEAVGVTTLANGWLLLTFKRPMLDNSQQSEPAHVGTYL